MSSITWLTRSIWPLVCGWKVELEFSVVSKVVCKLLQNSTVKCESQFDTMMTRTPCKRTMCWMYKQLKCSTEYVMLYAIKCAVLVSRSIITQIALWFCWDLGNPTTKSIDIFSHFHWGTGNGCNNLGYLWCFALTYWQVRHYDTYVITSGYWKSYVLKT